MLRRGTDRSCWSKGSLDISFSALRDTNVVATHNLLKTGIPMIFVTGGGGDSINDGYTVSKSVAQSLVRRASEVVGIQTRM